MEGGGRTAGFEQYDSAIGENSRMGGVWSGLRNVRMRKGEGGVEEGMDLKTTGRGGEIRIQDDLI